MLTNLELIYPIVPNRGAGIYNNFDENIPDFPPARPLFCSVLLMPARLFGPVLLFVTLDYLLKVNLLLSKIS